MTHSKKTRPAAAPRLTRLAALIATSCIAALSTMPAHAQTAAPAATDAAKDKDDALGLNGSS